MPSFWYRRATWAEVCDLGPQGWRLVAVPPIAEVKNVLGQQQMGEPLYAVEREAPDAVRDSATADPAVLLAAAGKAVRQEVRSRSPGDVHR